MPAKTTCVLLHKVTDTLMYYNLTSQAGHITAIRMATSKARCSGQWMNTAYYEYV